MRCLLWDFGNTLFDELSLWRVSPTWMDVYHSFDEADGLGARWNAGEIPFDEVVSGIAARTTLAAEDIRRHLTGTSLFEPFPATYAFFRARHLPQAIVTVNPTLFRDLATGLGLHRHVDAVVISGEEKTIDKGALCALALERMEIDVGPGEALLIDNKISCLEEWVARGGIGYHHRGDDAFAVDSASGVEGLTRWGG